MVDGTQYDHSSLLATVEALFGLKPLTARDGAASTLLKLLTRTTARTNAPAALGQAAVSGFTCDDDPPAGASSSSQSLTGGNGTRGQGKEPPKDPNGRTREAGPIGGSMRGFQEIALLKALKNARGRDRQQIRKEYLAADNHDGARRFIHKVASFVDDTRLPARRRIGMFRVLLSFRPRKWSAEPVSAYRGGPGTRVR